MRSQVPPHHQGLKLQGMHTVRGHICAHTGFGSGEPHTLSSQSRRLFAVLDLYEWTERTILFSKREHCEQRTSPNSGIRSSSFNHLHHTSPNQRKRESEVKKHDLWREYCWWWQIPREHARAFQSFSFHLYPICPCSSLLIVLPAALLPIIMYARCCSWVIFVDFVNPRKLFLVQPRIISSNLYREHTN